MNLLDASTGYAGRERLLVHGVRLEYLTIGWNVIEAAVAVVAGVAAGSLALIAFGLDSLIEVVAGAALLWRLRRELQDREGDTDHSLMDKRVHRVVGLTFFALAAYILAESAYDLIAGNDAAVSPVGIVLAAVSLMVMPVLALFKQRIARGLGSKALAADATETWVCSYLSLVLLAGLGFNAAFGWSWADTLAALAMLPLVIREGWEAFSGDDDD